MEIKISYSGLESLTASPFLPKSKVVNRGDRTIVRAAFLTQANNCTADEMRLFVVRGHGRLLQPGHVTTALQHATRRDLDGVVPSTPRPDQLSDARSAPAAPATPHRTLPAARHAARHATREPGRRDTQESASKMRHARRRGGRLARQPHWATAAGVCADCGRREGRGPRRRGRQNDAAARHGSGAGPSVRPHKGPESGDTRRYQPHFFEVG